MPAEIKSFSIQGPAGKLEALLNGGVPGATQAALVCHPHPLHGGAMHNKVVFHAMKALNGFGYPVLRFNFRGAGLSQGVYDHGHGEIDDVRAALDWLEREYHLPIFVAGFSFGAAIGIRASYNDDRANALIALGTPVHVEGSLRSFEFLRECRKPKLFLSGANDPYSPQAEMRAMVATLPEPKKLAFIEGAGHFFEGKLSEMRSAMEDWVQSL